MLYFAFSKSSKTRWCSVHLFFFIVLISEALNSTLKAQIYKVTVLLFIRIHNKDL